MGAGVPSSSPSLDELGDTGRRISKSSYNIIYILKFIKVTNLLYPILLRHIPM